MNAALKAVITFMLSKRYIGGKHFPEDKLIVSRTKWLTKDECREFDKAYKVLLNGQFILRIKKRTGKGYDWHVSLNPKCLKELFEMIRDD